MNEEFCYEEISMIGLELEEVLCAMEKNINFKLSEMDLKLSIDRINACMIRLGVISRLLEFKQAEVFTLEDDEYIF